MSRTDTLFPYTNLFRSCHDTLTLMIHSLDGNCAISTAWIIPPAGRRVVSSRSRIGSYCQSSLCGIVIYSLLPIRICLSSRSEEHTSELQSLMRISYAVFCLKKKKKLKQKKHSM